MFLGRSPSPSSSTEGNFIHERRMQVTDFSGNCEFENVCTDNYQMIVLESEIFKEQQIVYLKPN